MAHPRPEKTMRRTHSDAESSSGQEQQLLPDDLVLEIVARCGTIADAIRCASTSKPVRRGILSAPFLRRLQGFLRSRNNGGEYVNDDPAVLPKLLLGLYHQSADPGRQPEFAPASSAVANASLPPTVAALPPAPPDAFCGDSACDFKPYLPVASRRSLLVLRRRCKNTAKEHLVGSHGPHPVELTVCNPTTGERRVLPPRDVLDASHALLDVDPLAPSSSTFRLLVADLSNNDPRTLYAQVFSWSEEGGGWGPALACPITTSCEFAGAERPRPVVLGDTVHWLCTSRRGDGVLKWRCRGGGSMLAEKCLAVLPSPPGSSQQALLSMIGLERGEIEVWAREKSGGGSSRRSWKLWHRIDGAVIPRPRDLSDDWFCPLLLDLDIMEVSRLEARAWELNPEPEFCPYEVDLLSYVLYVMKRF
ncbi:hypothetical protein BS78_03G210400 [Paspalum vaginatum]|nr:hypothetical protein BS78_03G210400 [Paspalum vaginatum]